MKICMIVDDTPVIRKVARRIVEMLGYVVVEARDGEHALQLCFNSHPDVVIVDWDMPGMSGVEFISAFRAMEEGEKIESSKLAKIIYCTSELMVPEMTRAKRAGAAGFMMKPYNRAVVEEKFAQIGLLAQSYKAA